jgi:hypothetical protein
MFHRSLRSILCRVSTFVAILVLPPLSLQAQLIPNGEFQLGEDVPKLWVLSSGKGQWKDREILTVTGKGDDSNYWRCDIPVRPDALYRFRMRARKQSTGGSAIAGPVFANRDYAGLTSEWGSYSHIFRVPAHIKDTYVRLGHWQTNGTIEFDSVELAPVIPGYYKTEEVQLGEGESIQDNRYLFLGMYGHEASNFHRPLESFTASFNSDRWTFGGGSQVTYRFELPENSFTDGHVAFNVNYHTRGECIAEVSQDGEMWREVARRGEVGQQIAGLPVDLLPVEQLYFRVRAADSKDSFQVNRIAFTSTLSKPVSNATGFTHFAETRAQATDVRLEAMTLTGMAAETSQTLHVPVRNLGQNELRGQMQALVVTPDQKRSVVSGGEIQLAAGNEKTISLNLPRTMPGRHRLEFAIRQIEKPGVELLAFTTEYSVPDFYRVDYGAWLPGGQEGCDVWWCDSTRKVPRMRAAPNAKSTAVTLSAARNDHEAAQVVVRSDRGLKGLVAETTDLVGPDGAVIDAKHVEVRRVWYHFVTHPTDSTGVQDWWPDALPPLDSKLDVAPGHNQPIWVTVKVPENAVSGDYEGTLQIRADGLSLDVPLRLHVWDFALPDRNHLETAFGMSPGTAFQYHNVKDDQDRRQLLDLYFQSFSDHRISPYDPVPLDRIRTRFVADADPPYAELDFAAFDRAMKRAVERFHFSGYRLPVEGMGGGTFHSRYPPKIGEYGEETEQYQAMFSSYVKQLEQHFQEHGWLEMAYVYWFDEPAPRDYEFVTNGMERLRRYAPGLRRMLTEEPGDELKAPVDIWCPVTYNFDADATAKRQALGERIWWYVCTGPKAPYCTLFIDHPATEMRVWLWQTWKYNVQGILVWASNYWTSSAAFPDQPQNPYLDPMGYVSGYSTPKGVKAFWGNGDGRFIYPPLAAATPATTDGQPVLQPPVPSIRWEMLREGIEDYEFLWLLRELLEEKRDQLKAEQKRAYDELLTVPDSITKSMTEFTTDPTPIYARRAEIAQAIEVLRALD